MIEVELLERSLGGGVPSTLLQEFEAAAVDYVQKRTKGWFGADGTTIVEIKNGTGTSQLLLDNDPASITTIEVRGKRGDAYPFNLNPNLWVGVDTGNTLLQGNRLIRKAVIDLVGHWYKHRAMLRATDETEEPSIPESVNDLLDQWMYRREEQVLQPRLRRM